MIGLSLSVDYKSNSYDIILIIIDYLTKIMYHEPVKIMIDIINLVEIIIEVMAKHHGLLKLIISDQGLLFTLKN